MVVKPGYFGSPKGFQELSRGFSPANSENVEALFFLLSGFYYQVLTKRHVSV